MAVVGSTLTQRVLMHWANVARSVWRNTPSWLSGLKRGGAGGTVGSKAAGAEAGGWEWGKECEPGETAGMIPGGGVAEY